MIELPAAVKVGYRVFRIEKMPTDEACDRHRYGETLFQSSKIRIDTRHGLCQAAETLQHEIIHAVFWIYNIQDKDEEERTTCTLSNGLAAVWIDNPSLLPWLHEALTA